MNRHTACTLVAGLALLASCRAAATLNITLKKQNNVVADIKSVVVVMRKLSESTPEVFGPVDLEANPQFQMKADVDPDEEFYVDVVACTDPKRCEDSTIVARGCRNSMTLKSGEEKTLEVMLFLNAGERDLPPQPGVDDPKNGCPPSGPHTRP